MPINIISLAMTMLRNRESIARIATVLPDLQKIFAELTPEQPSPPPSSSDYPVGSMEWLQDSLNKVADAGLDVDGEYGPATNAAVGDYQSEHDLKVDGWAGPETISSILTELGKL
jgi:peptidoglycan hydrolase-like protein with peptidoglycan-binding domain